MAVTEALRGRGYGTVLLRAAEALVAELGETEVYLHLRRVPRCARGHAAMRQPRCAQQPGVQHPPAAVPTPPFLLPPLFLPRVQDQPAARLYARAGYEQVAADSFLVRLLAQDQRRLMRKRLPRPA
jgi:GNAT superfamily N-acetyltransferase